MTDLQVLKKMRNRLIWSLIFPKLKKTLDTDTGLCSLLRTFIITHGICDQHRYLYILLEEKAVLFGKKDGVDNLYWWPKGKIKPRLKTVNAAIKEEKKRQQYEKE